MSTLSQTDFEAILDRTIEILTENLRSSKFYRDPEAFEQQVREMLKVAAREAGVNVSPTFHPHAFPDIKVNGFGVEVKYTKKDTWLAVGNSIFEGMRDHKVKHIYIVYGKAGGNPEVKWKRYEDCITHVRVSHAPRFVIEMENPSPLFDYMATTYQDFQDMSADEKMNHVREYARSRLETGARLWWLENTEEPTHSLPIQVRLYMHLPKEEKLKLRAEATLLCPQVCGNERYKYTDPALYLLTYHGVLCPQTRDLFSAGSVAGTERGGKYVPRALQGIEEFMVQAALRLDDELFIEYWGKSCKPHLRIREWLKRADSYARDWTPSEVLFIETNPASC